MAGKFVFLYAGRLAAEKGVGRILHAHRAARQALPAGSVHLVIAGAGPQEAALRAAAPEDVTFLGYLDRAQALPELYASCDAFVFSSFTEMLGLVVLEAMASGLPVIAAPVGGVADHLHDRENGLAYAPSSAAGMVNALLTSVRDRELARRLASGARAAAQELCWTKEIDRLDASYRELCAMRTAVPA